MVAQGQRESGVQFKKDYDLPFPLLIDREMILYRQFGLRRKIKVLFKVETFTRYATQLIEGTTKSFDVYDGDDIAVMGGDFIVKQNGEVVFAYVQDSQLDRPAVEDFLQCLKK